MSYAQNIAEKIAKLPPEKQVEIYDFVEFIAARCGELSNQHLVHGEWSDEAFAELSMQQAVRGMEDDPVSYTSNDLKERWR